MLISLNFLFLLFFLIFLFFVILSFNYFSKLSYYYYFSSFLIFLSISEILKYSGIPHICFHNLRLFAQFIISTLNFLISFLLTPVLVQFLFLMFTIQSAKTSTWNLLNLIILRMTKWIPQTFLFDKYDLYSTRPRLLNQEQRYEKTSSESLPEIGRKNSYFLFLNFTFYLAIKITD